MRKTTKTKETAAVVWCMLTVTDICLHNEGDESNIYSCLYNLYNRFGVSEVQSVGEKEIKLFLNPDDKNGRNEGAWNATMANAWRNCAEAYVQCCFPTILYNTKQLYT